MGTIASPRWELVELVEPKDEIQMIDVLNKSSIYKKVNCEVVIGSIDNSETRREIIQTESNMIICTNEFQNDLKDHFKVMCIFC